MMDWGIFWEAAGAISTTLAVIVALWQTKYLNRKKVKIRFCENMTVVPNNGATFVGKNEFVGIQIANIGNRTITIELIWIKLPNKCRVVIHPDILIYESPLLPKKLDVDEGFLFQWRKEKFYKYINETKFLPRNKKVIFCVSDSTGRTYKCKSNKTIVQYLGAKQFKEGDS